MSSKIVVYYTVGEKQPFSWVMETASWSDVVRYLNGPMFATYPVRRTIIRHVLGRTEVLIRDIKERRRHVA